MKVRTNGGDEGIVLRDDGFDSIIVRFSDGTVCGPYGRRAVKQGSFRKREPIGNMDATREGDATICSQG